MTSPIPLINLQGFFSANEQDRASVVTQVREALEEVGFLTVIGHGVPLSLIDRVSDASLAFFDRPDTEKDRFKPPSKEISRGYSAMRGRTVGISQDPTLLKSLQESYGFGMMDAPDDPYFRSKAAGGNFATNIWPDAPVDFEPAVREYYAHMDRLFREMMRLFAIALDLPPAFFASKIDKHDSTLRLTHYPALDSEPLPGEQRAGAHTDVGTMTILHIDDTPNALKVQTRSGEWIDVNRIPGAFIINIGDLMMRWTNDKWVSNMHRVANPPMVNGRSERRLSLVYFCQTNYDTVVECLPNCSGPNNPPRYEPIVAGDYSAMRSALRYGYKLPAAS
jgi:isopenicillin N synthase-like dioxygenase